MDFLASTHHDILICSLLLCRFPGLVFLGFWSPIPARFLALILPHISLKWFCLVFPLKKTFPCSPHKYWAFSFSLFFSCVTTRVDSRLASSSKRRLINHKEKLQMKIKTKQDFEHELEAIEHDLFISLPFKRGQAQVWGDSQDKWDAWEKELEERREVILAKLES